MLQSDAETCYQQIMAQLHEDLKTYDAVSNCVSGTIDSWNIKRVVYRTTTLFVSGLGRLYSIDKHSCFDIVETMLRQHKICTTSAQSLSFAIAVACETRLKVYMQQESQSDYVGTRHFYAYDGNVVKNLRDLIGEQSLGDSFFTAANLQNAITVSGFSDELLFFDSLRLYRKFALLLTLDLRNLLFAEWERYILSKNIDPFSSDSDIVIRYYVAWAYIRNCEFKTALKMYNDLENDSQSNKSFPIAQVEIARRKAHCLCETQQYVEGRRYIKICLSKANISMPVSHHDLGYLLALQGDCERNLNMSSAAIGSYYMSLKHVKHSSSLFKNNLQIKCYYFVAQCQVNLGNFEDALSSLETSLEICENSNIEIFWVGRCYRLMAECYLRVNQLHRAYIGLLQKRDEIEEEQFAAGTK